MIALGIDPGTAICGYGFVETRGSRLRPLAYGSIFTTPDMPMEQRLMKIFDELDALIKQHKPDVMGVEKLFFSRNVTTAIPVGQARGVVLLAAAKKQPPPRRTHADADQAGRHRLWQGDKEPGHLHGHKAPAPSRAPKTRRHRRRPRHCHLHHLLPSKCCLEKCINMEGPEKT